MSSITVIDDLQGLLKLKNKAGEAPYAFVERLARKANSISDNDWGTLEDKTQRWVNDALNAIDKGQRIKMPEGLDQQLEAFPEEEGNTLAPPTKREKPAKKAKEAKPPVEKPKGPVFSRVPQFAPSNVITNIAEKNPYRENTSSFRWFATYTDGMTVQEALDAQIPRHHIRWDRKQKHIVIVDAASVLKEEKPAEKVNLPPEPETETEAPAEGE